MYAAYVYNRSYVNRINTTPYSLIYKKKPNISKLHRFGDAMFAQRDKYQCNLEPRSEEGNFLGFDPRTGGAIMINKDGHIAPKDIHVCHFPGESTTARGSADSSTQPTSAEGTTPPGGEPIQLTTNTESQDSRSTSPGGHQWGDLNIES